jgi:hypothetical protein
VAEEMTIDERLQACAKQWETAAKLLHTPFSPHGYERMAAYLVGRDALEEAPHFARQVHVLDRQFARALATPHAGWQRELTGMMARMDLADAPWWRRIVQLSADEKRKAQEALTSGVKVPVRH